MLFAFNYLVYFIFGTVIGSFLNVVILRGISGKEMVFSRSECPRCHKTLVWWELIPIVSYVFLRGKCSSCEKTISIQYPLVELAMGVILVLLGSQLPLSVIGISQFILIGGIAALLIVLFVTDLLTLLLPDIYVMVLGLLVLAKLLLVGALAKSWNGFAEAGWGILVGAGFILLLWLVTGGRGIGFGDVKLMIPLGVLFGAQGATVLLFVSFMAGGVFGLAMLASRRATMKTAIPFGPFLAGTAIFLLLVPQTINYIVTLVWPF